MFSARGTRLSPRASLTQPSRRSFCSTGRSGPEYILLLAGSDVFLLHYEKWSRGSYLQLRPGASCSRPERRRRERLPHLLRPALPPVPRPRRRHCPGGPAQRGEPQEGPGGNPGPEGRGRARRRGPGQRGPAVCSESALAPASPPIPDPAPLRRDAGETHDRLPDAGVPPAVPLLRREPRRTGSCCP